MTNLLLAVALGALLLGPQAATWLGAPSPHPPAPPVAAAADPGPAPSASQVPLAARADPVPTPTPAVAETRDARLAREARELDRAGRVAEACERLGELARTGAEATRQDHGLCLGRLGRDAYRAGQPAVAAEHYRRALETYPEGRELWTALATAYLGAGDLDRAAAVLADALRRFPEEVEGLYLLAETQERAGRTRDAAGTLRGLLARQPGHARAQTLLARLDREQRVEAGYWAQESAHFVVRYEGAGGIDLGRSVTDILEEAYTSIGGALQVYPKDRVQVGIYRTEVLGDVIGAPAHQIRGAFDGHKLRLNLAESVAYSNDLSRLVRHEYTHALVHLASRGRAPVWLHEGLAQVMEPRPAPRLLEVGVPRELLTLPGIERLSRTMEPAALTAGYQLTHVAVEHLVERGGLPAVRGLLDRLGRGEPVAQALREAFGFGPEEVEARLLAVAGKG